MVQWIKTLVAKLDDLSSSILRTHMVKDKSCILSHVLGPPHTCPILGAIGSWWLLATGE